MNRWSLLWREKGRVWAWYMYHRANKIKFGRRTYLSNAIRATEENPPGADRWLRGEEDYE